MSVTYTEFRKNRFLQGIVLWLALFWIVTAINPYDRLDWFLENLLVIAYATLLIVTYRSFQFSNASYLLFAVFITLHLVGAHYTYSETPLGYWIKDIFELERNHYDRLVHYSYGLLIAYPFRELLIRAANVNKGWSYFLAVNMTLAFSSFFEVLEAIIAELVSPELGAAYLGTQGDIWDAQKDVFLAFIGATTAMIITWLAAKKSPGI